MPDGDRGTELTDAGRSGALRDTGLSAAPDAGMDRFARLVTSVLEVPVALVSLVEPGRQVFPGMNGLAEPWARARQTPLTHSMCRHVVLSREPLILPDAREDELTCANLAIEDLGVVGYAGMPLTDADGHVLGSLCAIDTEPHAWTARELQDLADLAAACSAELRLRIVSRHHEWARPRPARRKRGRRSWPSRPARRWAGRSCCCARPRSWPTRPGWPRCASGSGTWSPATSSLPTSVWCWCRTVGCGGSRTRRT
ncbi:GAF domain-containing protein [Amycolatopsis sp. NPDC051758]|uniref:GAF domain-containing protein n=1 Tax=Amycolatopsis sp. NPDC051758 TaxID=3363935 RepID=UPI003799C70E